MNRIAVFFAIHCLAVHLMCQAQEADSIYLSLNQKPDNFSKVKELAASANFLASSNPVEAVKLARYIVNLSVKLNSMEGKAIAYNELGNAFERHSVYDSAFHYFFISYRFFSGINNQEGRGNTLINIGNAHEIMGNYDSAAYYAFKAFAFVDSMQNPNLKAKNLRVIGNIMYKTDRHEESIQYYLAALSLLKIQNNQPGLTGRVCENLALAYIKLSDYNAAENFFTEASEIYRLTKDPRDIARLNLNVASLRELQGEYQEALTRTQFALRFYKKINHPNGIAESFLTLSDICYKMRNYSDATDYALQAISVVRRRRDMDLEMDAYRMLQKINFERGDYKKAYQYQSAASLLHDTIFSEKKAAVISELQNQVQSEKKENEIKLLNKDNEIKTLTIKKQTAFRNSLIGGTVLILIISVLLFSHYRTSEKHKHQLERRRISSDLHDDVGSELSKITLLSQVLKKNLHDAQNAAELEKISGAATDALEKMSEMVWSLNPRNDKLENLIAYIRKYAMEYLDSSTVKCTVIIKGIGPNMELTGEQRRNVFLTVKEALHNILKHSLASNAELNVYVSEKRLNITIRDNGSGFGESKNPFGNGLLNMQRRMQESGGTFSIMSDAGTTVHLSVPIG